MTTSPPPFTAHTFLDQSYSYLPLSLNACAPPVDSSVDSFSKSSAHVGPRTRLGCSESLLCAMAPPTARNGAPDAPLCPP